MVVDASVVVHLVLDEGVVEPFAALAATERVLRAPHLLDLEVLQALRGRRLRREITPRQANRALDTFERLRITRFGHTLLRERIWALRGRLTACDAAYVALAEALGVPLVTLDRRLSRAAPRGVEVVLLGEG